MERIGTDEHVFVAGMTGSGKSFLAEVYLAGYQNVIMLDTKGQVYERRRKGENPWRGLKEGKDFTVIERLEEVEFVKTPKIIYAPRFEEQEKEYYDALMKYVYERENTILWIDELMSVAEGPANYPRYLKALMTRGRSKNVSVWALTQRPMDIPSIIFANTTHFFIFDLMLPQDRKKVSEGTGYPDFLDNPGKYNFWYLKIGSGREPVKARLNP